MAANLSQDDRDVVENHPPGNSLDHLLNAFRKEEFYSTVSDDSSQGLRQTMSSFHSIVFRCLSVFVACDLANSFTMR